MKSKSGFYYREEISKEFLEEFYVKNRMTCPEVADLLKCSKTKVHNALKKAGIPRRGHRHVNAGVKFGDLLVLERAQQGNKLTRSYWKCLCDCGVEAIWNNASILSRRNPVKKCRCSEPKKVGEIPGQFLGRARFGAEKRGLEFSISMEFLWNLFVKQDKKCIYTGRILHFGSRSRTNFSSPTASIDRIDSSKGYTEDNVQWVHKDVNELKSDFSEEELLRLVSLIYEHRLKN